VVDFKFIKTRDIWRRFPTNQYLHLKFEWFLRLVKELQGTYFDDAEKFCAYLPYEINYSKEFFFILHQLKLIHENHTVKECWVDKNIDAIDSYKDIVNIVENEIDINQFIRRKKLKKLKNGKV